MLYKLSCFIVVFIKQSFYIIYYLNKGIYIGCSNIIIVIIIYNYSNFNRFRICY